MAGYPAEPTPTSKRAARGENPGTRKITFVSVFRVLVSRNQGKRTRHRVLYFDNENVVLRSSVESRCQALHLYENLLVARRGRAVIRNTHGRVIDCTLTPSHFWLLPHIWFGRRSNRALRVGTICIKSNKPAGALMPAISPHRHAGGLPSLNIHLHDRKTSAAESWIHHPSLRS